MKKNLLCFLFVVLFPVYASAEQDQFQIDGEWYAASFYTNNYYTATKNDNGDFEITDYPENWKILNDGTILYGDSSEKMSLLSLSEDISLVYHVYYDSWSKQDVLGGYLLICDGDEAMCVRVSEASLILILSGHMIKHDGTATADCLLSGNHFYMTNGDNYTRGTIRIYNNDLFMYYIDEEPYIYKSGNYERDYGTPVMLFIRSSGIEE